MVPRDFGDILSREPLRYRPHLDGVRAIAVYLVVAFHAGLGGVSGGFIGVDVFYVLSGFLVTSILLRDLVSRERIDWRRFYSRRVRRILPAACLTLVVSAAAYAVIATPLEMQDAVGGFRAAFLYVANWFFLHQSASYFGPNVNTNPVLHFWSLAVEEQFYVLWPIIFGGVFALARRAPRWQWSLTRGTVLALGLISGAAAWHLAAINIDRAYYGTDTRAYQLLAGAFLALTPQVTRASGRMGAIVDALALVALSGVVIVSTSLVDVSPITRGMITVVVVVALIAALESAPSRRTSRMLGARPVTYLGRVSYATYLWHWPLVVLITRDHQVGPLPLFLIVAPGSTVLAVLSFHLVEMPIRRARVLDRHRIAAIAARESLIFPRDT